MNGKLSRFIIGLWVICALCSCTHRPKSAPEESPRQTKLLIIGLDGATWTVIDPLLSEGKLPNIQRLVEQGVSGTLRTLDNPLSVEVWTSILTGKNSDKHGITAFISPSMAYPANSTMRKVRDLPEILSLRDHTVGFVGFWASWPAEKVKGWMVSDLLSFGKMKFVSADSNYAKNFSYLTKFNTATYPESLLKEIYPLLLAPEQFKRQDYERLALFNDEEWERFKQIENFSINNNEAWLKFGLPSDTNYLKIALYIAQKKPEVLAVYFEVTDSFAHYFWKYYEPGYFLRVDPRKLERFRETIPNYYQLVDQFIGDLIKAVGPGVAVLMVSDHGMERLGKNSPKRIKCDTDLCAGHYGECNGIIIFSGLGIRKGEKVEGAGIMDITPTVLYYMGAPVAEDMDGKPLPVFTDEFVAQHALKTIPTYETKPRKVKPRSSPLDDEIIKKLRALGYIR